MREAFELAWANTYVFGKSRPFGMHMDDILFKNPVEVGQLLYFNSQVCYTQDNYIQNRVSAEVSYAVYSIEIGNLSRYIFLHDRLLIPRQES